MIMRHSTFCASYDPILHAPPNPTTYRKYSVTYSPNVVGCPSLNIFCSGLALRSKFSWGGEIIILKLKTVTKHDNNAELSHGFDQYFMGQFIEVMIWGWVETMGLAEQYCKVGLISKDIWFSKLCYIGEIIRKSTNSQTLTGIIEKNMKSIRK